MAARAAPPLAAGALLVLLAAFQADRASTAETAYLALWIVAALLPAAALAPAPAWEGTLGAPLAALAVWALPAGPARSAALGALLVAALALAASRALGARRRGGLGGREHLALTMPLALGAQMLLRGELLLAPGAADLAALVALPALGALALALLAARYGLPAALLAGAAAVTLGPGWTAVTTLALAGAAVGAEAGPLLDRLQARGWLRRAAGGAGAPAGRHGSPAARHEPPETKDEPATGRREPPAGRHAPPAGRGARTLWAGSWAPLALGAAFLAGGLAIETRASAAALAAGAVVALARPHRLAGPLALLLAVALPAAAALAPLRPWPEALRLLAWAPILLPALAWAPGLPRPRRAPLVAALGLAAAGAVAVPGPAAPAAALAALAVLLAGRLGGARNGADEGGGIPAEAEDRRELAAERGGREVGAGGADPPRTSEGREVEASAASSAAAGDRLGSVLRAAAPAQTVWSAALLAGAALLASYPWLRPAPAADALAWVGLTPGWGAAAALLALALAFGLGARVIALGGGARLGARGGRAPRLPAPGSPSIALAAGPAAAWAAALAIGGGLFAALPSPARPAWAGPAAALGPARPRLAIELDGAPVGTVDLFSRLSGAAELAAGTEVAQVRLLGAGGEPLARWALRAGEGTGEWAARRADVAALPTLAAPPPWTGWVEARGDSAGAAGEAFFGQSYRARWTARPPAPAARMVIERSAALPSGVALSVHRVEVAP